jgi:hypothetical protein
MVLSCKVIARLEMSNFGFGFEFEKTKIKFLNRSLKSATGTKLKLLIDEMNDIK